jgi:hypothetical protein
MTSALSLKQSSESPYSIRPTAKLSQAGGCQTLRKITAILITLMGLLGVLTTQNFIEAARPKQGVSGKGRYIKLYRYYNRQIAEGSTVVREVVYRTWSKVRKLKIEELKPRAGQSWRLPILSGSHCFPTFSC